MSLVLNVIFVFLFVFHGVRFGNTEERVTEENEDVTLQCKMDGTVLYWLRLRDNAQVGFEYIATYQMTSKKDKTTDDTKFSVNEKTLRVTRFKQEEDSGYYSCVSINNNELRFSGTIKLRRKTAPTIKPTVKPTRAQTIATTTKAVVTCEPNSKGSMHVKVLWGCEQHIYIPLATGCGVLLLVLIITILCCNRIRTRRCPHHYKRQPRSRPAGHKTLPNPLN